MALRTWRATSSGRGGTSLWRDELVGPLPGVLDERRADVLSNDPRCHSGLPELAGTVEGARASCAPGSARDADVDDVGDQRPRLVDRVVAHEALDGVHGVGVEHGLGQAGVWALSSSPKASITRSPPARSHAGEHASPGCRSQALASALTALPWVYRP